MPTMSNTSQPKVEASSTPTPMLTPKLKYPIFLECLQYTLDPYWRQVFEDCARGRFPKGSGIDTAGNAVYFKGKNVQWHQLSENPELLYCELKGLFQNNLNLKSKKDRSDTHKEVEVLKTQIESLYSGTWHSIRKKSIKDALIRNFVLNLKEAYSLSQQQTIYLHRLLQLGFLFNWIDPDSVKYEDKQILEIGNLYYDDATQKFELELSKPKKIKREFVPKAEKISSLWKKNLGEGRNKYSRA